MSQLWKTLLRAGVMSLALLLVNTSGGAERVIRAESMTVAPGETNRLYVMLEALGDENTLAFSVCFDTDLLTFISARRGTNVGSAQYIINTNANQISLGRMGVLISLPAPQTFAAGTYDLWEVLFRAGPNAAVTTVSLCDLPAERLVLDGSDDVNVLPAQFVDATVVIQGTCSYSLNMNSASFTAAGGTDFVHVTTDAGCVWSVDNTNSWIMTSLTNGMESGTVSYTVAANTSLTARTGVMTMAGQTFTVNQAGFVCAYSLSATTRQHAYVEEIDSVQLTTSGDCAWTVVSSNDWITILTATSGSGVASVDYAVALNPNLTSRTGSVMIADQLLTLIQGPFECAYSISATNRGHDYRAATNSVELTTSAACPWTVASSNEWITILSAVNGNGSSSVDYAVAPNPNLVGRTGSVMIADQLLTLIQGPFECSYQLSPAGGAPGPAASSNSFDVFTAGVCDWAATTTNNWLTLVSGVSGPGSNTVGYLIAANPDGLPRSGAIFAGDQVFEVTQSAAPCVAELTPASRNHGFGFESGVVNVAIPGGCPWQVVNTNAWITIDSAADGAVGYTVASNTVFAGRSGVLTIAGIEFTVSQAAAPCLAIIAPASASHGFGMETGFVSVAIGNVCGWTVNNTNTWITIFGSSGTGDGEVTYSVSSNLNVTPRSGTLWIDGTPFVVNQAAYVCAYELSLTNITHDFGVSSNSVNVTAGPNCEWSAITTNDWISIAEGAGGTGNGSFSYSLLPNAGATARTGAVMVAGQVLTIAQSASAGGFAFETITMGTAGELALRLSGGPPGIWEIQTSSNLVTWTKLTDITNTTGKVEFIAPSTGNEKRFYRAVLP